VRYAQGDGAPPRELAEFERFVRYGLPPLGGGQRDQPAGWFERAEALWRAAEAWRQYKRADLTAAWMKEHQELWDWAQRIEEKLNNG